MNTEQEVVMPARVRSKHKTLLWVALVTLVAAHLALVLAFTSSFFVLPFMAPWYQAVPTMTFIWFFSTSKIECKFTALENCLRKSLGLRTIGGFVGHYFYKPVRILVRKYTRPRVTGDGDGRIA